MVPASDFLCENDEDIPRACEQISRKLVSCSAAALAQCLLPEQISFIKQTLHSEVNDLRQLIKSEQDYLKSVKNDVSVCKEKIAMIGMWEDGFKRLDSVLPVIKKPTSLLVNGSCQHQATASCVTLKPMGTTKRGIPTFRCIEESEWNTVPSYLKLRLKLEQVNNFVLTLNKELIEKYTLLQKKKSTLKTSELTLRASYVELETSETKGLYFVVTSDLKKIGLSEKTISNMSAILRHCRRLREMRTGKTTRYIVTD